MSFSPDDYILIIWHPLFNTNSLLRIGFTFP